MPKNELEIQWEKILEKEGLSEKLPKEQNGRKVRLGLGVKGKKEEDLEDNGGHSKFCPINLGVAISGKLDQTNDRPVESEVENADDL